MTWEAILRLPALQHLGWSLAHFVWQALLAGMLLALALRLLRHEPPRLRYAAALITMLVLLALPAATFLRGELETARAAKTGLSGASTAATIEALPTEDGLVGERELQDPAGRAPLAPQPQPVSTNSPHGNRIAQLLEPLFARVQSTLPWIVLVWAAGALALTVRVIGGLILLRRWCRPAAESVPPLWTRLANERAGQLGLHRPVRMRMASHLATPLIVGFFRPLLLVPTRGMPALSDEQISAVLGHELAHIRRRDGLGQFVQIIAETLFFYHPVVWWVSRQMHCAREQSCDDLAAELSGDRLLYARALTDMEESRQSAPRFALAGTRGFLHQRIRRLLENPVSSTGRSPAAIAVVYGVVSIAVLALASYLPDMPLASEPYPTTVGDYDAQVRAALARGDDGRALELACHAPSHAEWASRGGLRDIELTLALDGAMRRRYREAFRPPRNVEDLLPFDWDNIGRSFGFGDEGGAGMPMNIEQDEGGFSLTIDVDRDGRNELTYNGRSTSMSGNMSQVVDRDPEGRRAQWLLAPLGVDPRERAQVMLYRDGDFYLVLVDADGDGLGDCGRSGSTVPRPSTVKPEPQKDRDGIDTLGQAREAERSQRSDESEVALPSVSAESAPPQGAEMQADVQSPSNEWRPRSKPDPEIARRWAAFHDSVQRALDAGDDAAVAELLCPFPSMDIKSVDWRFFASIYDALARRYAAAFTPPANADSMWYGGLRGTNFMTAFNRGAVASVSLGTFADSTGKSMSTIRSGPRAALETETEPCHLRVERARELLVIVDLDLDGRPEVTYDGGEPTIAAGWAVAVDRAPDGRLVQWLISPSGTDPRDRVQVWMCRDTGTFWILLDTDGDGSSDCGWGGCMN